MNETTPHAKRILGIVVPVLAIVGLVLPLTLCDPKRLDTRLGGGRVEGSSPSTGAVSETAHVTEEDSTIKKAITTAKEIFFLIMLCLIILVLVAVVIGFIWVVSIQPPPFVIVPVRG